jgi:hypothetical protein
LSVEYFCTGLLQAALVRFDYVDAKPMGPEPKPLDRSIFVSSAAFICLPRVSGLGGGKFR